MAKQLVAEAKTCASEGELYKSLKLFKKAYKLVPSDKIQSRITRIEEAIAAESDEDDDENFGFVELDNGIVIYKKLIERLYPHQIEGVKWLYNLYDHKMKGGILADDMGLGKTIQVIAFLSAMFDMKLIKHILLVLPLSVIPVHDISPSITRMAENLKLSGNNITTNSTTNIEVVNDSDVEDVYVSGSDSNENANSVTTSFDDITAPIDDVITAAKVVNDSSKEDFQVSSSNSCENLHDVTKSFNDITAHSDEVTTKDEDVDDSSNNVTSLPETSQTETWHKSPSTTAKNSDFDFKLSVSDEEDDFNDLASNDSSNEIPIFEVHDHDDYE
uniref:SNF2 N-terminal domain-containing protein n=1 Tax=Ciona savignyi TaxID=51511 RepID=H2ZIR0_CIOSA